MLAGIPGLSTSIVSNKLPRVLQLLALSRSNHATALGDLLNCKAAPVVRDAQVKFRGVKRRPRVEVGRDLVVVGSATRVLGGRCRPMGRGRVKVSCRLLV